MPLLSIVIPTHNRSSCAISAIRSILSISDEVQVVVSDSSDVDLISCEFRGVDDPAKLKIIRHISPINIVDNFNLALNAADGEYLVFIGDDDFVNKEIIDIARWAKKEHVDAIKFSFPAMYYWPDFLHASRGGIYAGTLQVTTYTGQIAPHDSHKALAYALKNFGGGVFEMPRAYAGMLSSSLAKDIVAKYGALFGGVSPDIYSSALISFEAKKPMFVDYPIIVPGAAGKSGTGQSASGGHRGTLQGNAYMAAFKNLIWDDRIPAFYSVPTVWAFSLLKAIEQVQAKNTNYKQRPNFGRLILKCFSYHFDNKHHAINSFKSLTAQYGSTRMVGQVFHALWSEFFWGLQRIRNRFMARNINKTVLTISDLEDSVAASLALSEHVRNSGQKLRI